MFGIAGRLMQKLRQLRRAPGRSRSQDATAYLQSSPANRERLNAAIAELNAGRGSLASMTELHGQLGEPATR